MFRWTQTALLVALFACSPTDDSGQDGDVADAMATDRGVMPDQSINPDGGFDPDGGVDTPACLEMDTVDTGDGPISRCLTGHADPPFVRLPPDTATTRYASFNGTHFVDRQGQNLDVPANAIDGEVADENHGDRYGYAIYRLTFEGGTFTALTPAVLLDDRVFLERLKGVHFQGAISRHLGEGEYELDPSLPIALTLEDAIELSNEPDSLHGYPIHTIYARLANLDTGITRPDGSCLAALTDAGAQNPFAGLTDVRLPMSRIPNMHGGFDDVIVIAWPDAVGGSNMGGGGYLTPIELARDAAPAPIAYGSHPHGNPTSAPTLSVEQVSPGAPCP